ncbi:hypothetical protein [Mesorhizobium sp. ES1-3]|uniref:hypothetical protein n=1 Tax=Mesorhizobium sp. ES1-3 TaxID=2876628 RepID=UPI001CCA666C|nr:hypothetical protein [Mesorhizobium sp. ES1-3]MBZ9671647.1 hypothetical protein [Mesorhizobium sp. ES1-3]
MKDAILSLEDHERRKGLRTRKRRLADQRKFGQIVTAVLSDVLYSHFRGRAGGLRISRSKDHHAGQSRYGPSFGKTLPDVLDRLASPELGLITQRIGRKSLGNPQEDRQTVIGLGPQLLSAIEGQGMTTDDFAANPTREVIILKRSKGDYWDQGETIAYADTEATMAYRREVRAINQRLAEADIECFAGDASDRTLRRIFTEGRFDCGGRLFGGFWQPMSKADRHENIFIDGESVVELDYDQMSARILYGLAGVSAPSGDLYSVPGLEGHREGVKKVLNAMLFAHQRPTRFPRGTRPLFPARLTVAEVMDAIADYHGPLKDVFFCGMGHRAQFVESEIMVDVLLSLQQVDVTALPVHDAIWVPTSAKDIARKAMLTAFMDHTGQPGSVSYGSIR